MAIKVPHLFAPFYRGQRKGDTGFKVGLATVKRIIDSHGGRIGGEMAPGKGCTFSLHCPSTPRILEIFRAHDIVDINGQFSSGRQWL
jgi:signal transduction histidine kinase